MCGCVGREVCYELVKGVKERCSCKCKVDEGCVRCVHVGYTGECYKIVDVRR